MSEHIIIKCSLKEYGKEYQRLKSLFDEKSFYCEILNSLGGEPHPQFTIRIVNRKITLFTTEAGIKHYMEGKK